MIDGEIILVISISDVSISTDNSMEFFFTENHYKFEKKLIMKMVLSPAKSLNFDSDLPTNENSKPIFLTEAKQINELLKEKSPNELSSLMKISEKLATLNWERNKNFSTPFDSNNARPAIYSFDGDVYSGLDVFNLPKNRISLMQNSLRILSGLYGILKPLDLIQPYRLEMATNFPIKNNKNLYEFWKDKVTSFLNEELEEGELFVNLASNEYFSVINPRVLNSQVITPQFKDFKNGTLKMISFYAKKARGMMARYLIESDEVNAKSLLGFNYGGYSYSDEHTKSPLDPVFIR
ncbi:MAG: peroxide stress protein YaaA [Bacteroidota bacterium]|nr:peroxide stress protein YaaA [Bacteroidota bacterium]